MLNAASALTPLMSLNEQDRDYLHDQLKLAYTKCQSTSNVPMSYIILLTWYRHHKSVSSKMDAGAILYSAKTISVSYMRHKSICKISSYLVESYDLPPFLYMYIWVLEWSSGCNANSWTTCLILQLRRPPLNIVRCITGTHLKLRPCEFSLKCFATVNCILNLGEMMGHHYFNDKAAVLIRRPSTLKALKCLYSANVLLTVTEVYTPWGTRLQFTK